MLLFPNAKINIGLDIIARRPDGYHDISTVMIPVKWCDILEVVPASGTGTTLSVTGRSVGCEPEKNLVMKAYRALSARIPIPPVDIFLHKVIPDGAGLGGGSADAAFTLRALDSMFSLSMSRHELASIAATIGADCPFFIYDTPMLCEGIGDRLTPVMLDLSGLWILIVKPPVSVPTAKAYAGTTPRVPLHNLSETIQRPVAQWTGLVKNDFEPSVFASYPDIADMKKRIEALGAVYTAMSGSGASVYGIFNRDILADSVRELFPQCDIFSTPLE